MSFVEKKREERGALLYPRVLQVRVVQLQNCALQLQNVEKRKTEKLCEGEQRAAGGGEKALAAYLVTTTVTYTSQLAAPFEYATLL